MDAEKTIGELISEALRSSSIMEESARQFEASQRAEADRTIFMGKCLSRALADNYHLQFEEAWDALCHVPDHMLQMLATSYGWTVLGEYVAASLGLTNSDPLIPTVH